MKHTLLTTYERHAGMAAAYAEQQMLDRDAGRHVDAVLCQQQADLHADMARSYRDAFVKALKRR